MRILILPVLLALSCSALAQECESVVALSKVVSTVVSDKESVDQHAANFCSEYAKSSGRNSSASFGASYKFLSASLGKSNASHEEVASKYCSASNSSWATKDAYRQYIESISPNAYSAYEQCLRMSTKQDLKFNVNLGSVLPDEFSMSVAFVSQVSGSQTAKLAFSTSSGISCKWNGANDSTLTMTSGTSAILECTRTDQTRRGYVNVVRTDAGSGAPLILPWQEYTKDGVPVDTVLSLRKAIAALQEEMNINTANVASLSQSEIEVFKCPTGNSVSHNANWMTIGCNGQISSESSCRNYWANGKSEYRSCVRLGKAPILK